MFKKVSSLRENLQKIYADYPKLFWIVVGTSFIDGVGGTMLFPFFSLYITQKFNVGMTEAGVLLGMIGGGLCALSALAYYALHLRLGKRERFAPQPAS